MSDPQISLKVTNSHTFGSETAMSSGKQFTLGISEDILNGIHPGTQTAAGEQKWSDKGEENYFGIPADILDGIHPRIQSDEKKNPGK